MIRSCRDRGFYSETGSKGGQPNGYVDLPECYIGPIWVQDSGDQAFRFDGPHDATITWLIAAGAGQNYGTGLGPPAVEFGGTATSSGACDIGFIHQYAGTGIGIKFGTSHIFADHIQAETNHLEGVVALGDINHINFIRAFNNNRVGTAGQYYNIRLGQNVHVGIAQATCSNNAGGIEIGVYSSVAQATVDGSSAAGAIGINLNGVGATLGAGHVRDLSGSGSIGVNIVSPRSRLKAACNVENCATGVATNGAGANSIFDFTGAVNSGQTWTRGSRSSTSFWRMAWRDGGADTNNVISEQPIST